jgi:hypothetical protein
MAVEMTKKQAVALCEAVGFKTARRWQKAKMAAKLVEIAELAKEGDVAIEDEELDGLLKSLIESNGEATLVVDGEQKEKVAPVEPEGEAPVKKKRERKAKAKMKKDTARSKADGKPKRPKVMGKYAAGPFVRWLGRKGMAFDGAKSILEAEGITHLSDGSIKWELKEKREDHAPAKVSKEDIKVLMDVHSDVFGAV